MNSCELTAYITAVANVIAASCTTEEIDLLSVIFVQLGDTLATKSVFSQLCDEKKTK